MNNNTSVVEINSLWKDGWREYSAHSERVVSEYLQRHLGIQFVSMTEGYAPEYDVLMSDGKYEIKITQNEYISVEFARADGSPSGISVSESDFYLIVHKGYGTWIDGKMRAVGKVRRIPTQTLKKVALSVAEHDESRILVHEASVHGPGSMCVRLQASKLANDFKSCGVKDGWIGDILLDTSSNGEKIYDFGQEGNRNWSRSS